MSTKLPFGSLVKRTDSYKVSHSAQSPDGTTNSGYYFEARGGKPDKTVFFGLQYKLHTLLSTPSTIEEVEEMEEDMAVHFGRSDIFPAEGWRHVVRDHGGLPPLLIKAVPEGTVVPTGNALFTVESTCPQCHWLSGWVEPELEQVWYPTVIASRDRENRIILEKYADLTGSSPDVSFKLHDFGYRGVTSTEHAAIGGAAHLIHFQGTDTLVGLWLLKEHYDAPISGFSIPAAEHGTIMPHPSEREAFAHMLKTYPTGMVAVVSDTYDIFNACENLWGGEFHSEIMGRDGTLVVRPDSGDPPSTLCKVLDILTDKFGHSINSKGFKVLPPQIRVIQGDGIDPVMMQRVLSYCTSRNYALDNYAFGSGGGLLMKVCRDDQRVAYKESWSMVNGELREFSKHPITDPGKVSKEGQLELVVRDGAYKTVRRQEVLPTDRPMLEPVYLDGHILRRQSFADICERAVAQMYS